MSKQQAHITADIDFEKELWGAANELRGAVAENQYKDYVLSLIFLKHVSESYEARREELEAAVKDKNSVHYTTDQDDIIYTLQDKDEYYSVRTVLLPETATWTYLKNNAEQDNIKVLVDEAFKTVDSVLSEYKTDLKGILPPIFVKSQLSAQQTSELWRALFTGEQWGVADSCGQQRAAGKSEQRAAVSGGKR